MDPLDFEDDETLLYPATPAMKAASAPPRLTLPALFDGNRAHPPPPVTCMLIVAIIMLMIAGGMALHAVLALI
ncbi:MAG: hypothetical protein AAGF11_27785 [Myxococcota bacterium]